MSKPIVLVTGGRHYNDTLTVERALSEVDPGLVMDGGAQGADNLAAQWARDHGVHTMRVDARWGTYGNAAGPIRNGIMVRIATLLRAGGASVLVVAFPGEDGTADCVAKAQAAGLDVREVGG